MFTLSISNVHKPFEKQLLVKLLKLEQVTSSASAQGLSRRAPTNPLYVARPLQKEQTNDIRKFLS